MNETLRLLLAAALFVAVAGPAAATEELPYGRFIGEVKARWLDDGRRMQLLDMLAFVDPRGTVWEAPKDWIIDGASITQLAWSLIGGPYEDKYRKASVIHDVACDQKTRRWEDVHEAFYYAMRASGVSGGKARL